MDTCPCGSNMAYEECCMPVIKGAQPAATAEQLMRSRYSAYAKKEISYLFTSLHPDHRANFDEKGTRTWAESAEWHKLEIVRTAGGQPEDSEGEVEFIASYTEQGIKRDHHETATFAKHSGTWHFVDGKAVAPQPVVRAVPKTGRNDPCPCGSGRKFKKCCRQ